MSDAPVRLLLGPQRPEITLASAIDAEGLQAASFAVIAAGWQEAEGDLHDVEAALGRPVEDLGLYARADALFRDEAGLYAAYRQRQDRLQELQRLYRLRLRQLAIAARQVLRPSGEPELAAAEQQHAIRQLRALDRHHLRATEKLHLAFESAWSHQKLAGWQRQHEEIAARIDAHDAVLITGGNVIVLMNRMRLFGADRLLAGKPVVGWSAGAMVLARRIVLFHDRMPQGRRDPEMLGFGFGLVDGTIVMPDGANRLRQRDALRLGLVSRRFGPDRCTVLDNGARLRFDGKRLGAAHEARRITRGGRLVKVKT